MMENIISYIIDGKLSSFNGWQLHKLLSQQTQRLYNFCWATRIYKTVTQRQIHRKNQYQVAPQSSQSWPLLCLLKVYVDFPRYKGLELTFSIEDVLDELIPTLWMC